MPTSKLIFKSDQSEELRIVWAEVYAPNRPDSDGEFMTAETIREAAYDFVRKGRLKNVDVEHNNETRDGVEIVESFIARKGDPDFIEGSWVVGVHIPDDDLWGQVKKGEINGFSLEAFVQKEPQFLEMDVPPVLSGKTSKSEGHEHKFYVSYDQNGVFKGGVTDSANGHNHVIKAGTITEETNGHRHRFSSVDGVTIITERD